MNKNNENKEQKEVNFWKRQAYILHSKLGQCRQCSDKENTKLADLYFEMGGADCIECPDLDNKKCINIRRSK
jgi:hypothetical protein